MFPLTIVALEADEWMNSCTDEQAPKNLRGRDRNETADEILILACVRTRRASGTQINLFFLVMAYTLCQTATSNLNMDSLQSQGDHLTLS